MGVLAGLKIVDPTLNKSGHCECQKLNNDGTVYKKENSILTTSKNKEDAIVATVVSNE